MQKVKGVEKVRVSLNEGLTILDLAPGNTLTLAAVRQIIKHNGFVSKEATVIARGAPASAGGQPAFEVSGTGERLAASSEPERLQEGEWRVTVPPPPGR